MVGKNLLRSLKHILGVQTTDFLFYPSPPASKERHTTEGTSRGLVLSSLCHKSHHLHRGITETRLERSFGLTFCSYLDILVEKGENSFSKRPNFQNFTYPLKEKIQIPVLKGRCASLRVGQSRTGAPGEALKHLHRYPNV